ncbi:MAG: glucose-6-phosphate isomerase, partial [Pseudomonadota bacterium]
MAAGDRNTAWTRVREAHGRLDGTTLKDLFAQDADRFDQLSFEACDILMDVSKQRIDADALTALIALAEASDVRGRRDAMFAGEAINVTEGRSVRHMALRAPKHDPQFSDVAGDVHDVLDRMLGFAERVRSGSHAAADGETFTDVINIGIGGSDLGPVL